MESTHQRAARLIAALEDLVDQEAVCFRSRDLDAVNDIQTRAAPLVDALVADATRITDQKLRSRLAAVVARRNETAAAVAVHVQAMKDEIDRLQTTQRRASQIAPVYGRGFHASPRQLSAVG